MSAQSPIEFSKVAKGSSDDGLSLQGGVMGGGKTYGAYLDYQAEISN